MRSKSTAFIPILILTLTLAACHPGGSEDSTTARESLDRNLEPRKVKEIVPEIREERPSVALVGEVRAFDSLRISSEVAGRVEQVDVEVGDRVTKGQALLSVARRTFELRLRQAEARIQAAKADLDLARRELARKQDLVSDKTIPQAAFDQAQARHDLAAAALLEAVATRDLAQHDFEVSIVRAPAAGAVTGRSVVAGQWADVGEGLLEMAIGTKVKIVARVPSHWVGALQGLDGFDFTVGTHQPTRRAKLYSIDPVVQEASRSFEVVGTVPAEGLKPGMFANVTLEAPDIVQSLWLPVAAILTSDTPKVYMAQDGRIAVRRIQTGLRDDGMIEVISGLDQGERVIADVAGLSRDLPVEVVE